jgi:hypothetical protein
MPSRQPDRADPVDVWFVNEAEQAPSYDHFKAPGHPGPENRSDLLAIIANVAKIRMPKVGDVVAAAGGGIAYPTPHAKTKRYNHD